ncbi:anti-sigma factor domain-containing protein [Salipaludibacillus daqingensis]|uniref:anti-sigma factor domain-containing protein n=1 Tax=Salipaludibacillus daqingensis TaxID=3041001 RepID=UPI0024770535|nr:anti-sigma factor domain-containing protein [Salipaludibacillus daqingensis]
MKKGVVMEVTNRHMIVLTKDGQFIRAKTKKAVDIGEEVSYSALPLYQFSTFFERKMYSVPLASVLAILLIFPISSFFQTSTVYGVVSLDMNPSVELAVNDHYEIVSTVGYNEKGKRLLKKIEKPLEGMNLFNAASELLKESLDQGMMKDTRSIYLSSALSFQDEVEFESWSMSVSDEYNFDIHYVLVDDEMMEDAKELSVSPAKLFLFSNNEGKSFDLKDLSDTAMTDIEQAIGQDFSEIPEVDSVLNDSSEEDENDDDTSGSDHSYIEPKAAELNNSLDDDQTEENEEESLNPAGKQSHPHKEEHPGKGNANNNKDKENNGEGKKDKKDNNSGKKDKKDNSNKEKNNKSENKGNKNSSTNNGNSNKSNGNGGSSGNNGNATGKPDHASSGKSNSKPNGR